MRLFRRKIPVLTAILFSLIYGLSARAWYHLARAAAPQSKEEAITLTATTTLLADLARQIGSGRITVDCLMSPGTDPHTCQADPGDTALLKSSDLILYHGLFLEGKLGEILSSLQEQGRGVICIEDAFSASELLCPEDNPGTPDPHVWFDVALWQKAAVFLSKTLSEYDPEYQSGYENNLASYLEELNELDGYIRFRTGELEEEQRVLITAHDAFRYFGNAYGYEVKGLLGISTDSEAGTADIISLADYIAAHGIRAVFTESSLSPKALTALTDAAAARGMRTIDGGRLYSDSLGAAGSGADTYLLMFRSNIDTIVDALTY